MKKFNMSILGKSGIIAFSVCFVIGLFVGHFCLNWTPGYRWELLRSNSTGLLRITTLNEEIVGTLEEHKVFEVTLDSFVAMNEAVITVNESQRNIILAGLKDDMPKNFSVSQLNQLYESGSTMYLVISDAKTTDADKYIGYLFKEYPKRLNKDANDSINAQLFYQYGATKTGTDDNLLELFYKKW